MSIEAEIATLANETKHLAKAVEECKEKLEAHIESDRKAKEAENKEKAEERTRKEEERRRDEREMRSLKIRLWMWGITTLITLGYILYQIYKG